MTRRRRWVLAGATAAASLLVSAPSALGAFGLTGLSATPASTNAGANSNFSIALTIQEPAADLKDLTIHLPPGLVGNPLATPTCTEEQLAADACPALSDVGNVTNNLTAQVGAPPLVVPVPLTVNGNLFNVTPRAGEPARFGIVLNPTPLPIPGNPVFPKIILQSAASLRADDFGLDTVLTDLPRTATVAGLTTPIDLNSLSLTLSGMAGNPPKGFIRNPTSCKTHTVGFDATAYDAQTASGQTTFTTTNCGALPFSPEFEAQIEQGASNEAVKVTTTISQTIEEAGLKRAQVILPKELGGSNAALSNTCPVANFQAGTCPAASTVGFAFATSPLQSQPLAGPVSLLVPATPGLPDLGVDLKGSLAIQLIGKIALTPETRNVVTFDGLPDIPISTFALSFGGGPNGLTFSSRDLCQPPAPTFDTLFDSHAGGSLALATPASVSGACPTGPGTNSKKKPKAKVKLAKPGSEQPRLTLKVTAGSSKISTTSLKLPKQLSFAKGKTFKGGAVAKADGRKLKKGIKASKRSLQLKVGGSGAKRLTAKVAEGALVPASKVGKKLKFVVKVRDTLGKTTKIVARAP